MKKLFMYAMLLMSLCLFTACPSDEDEDEINSTSSASAPFVGYWVVDGVKNPTQKKGVSVAFVLFKEGKMRVGSNETYETWRYNETTKLLATTAYINNVNLQWEITLIGKNQWAGIGLWDITSSSSVANRGNLNNLSQAGALTNFLLYKTNWAQINNPDKKLYIQSCSTREFYCTGSAVDHNGAGWTNFSADDVKYDEASDILVIENRKSVRNITIQHPFSLSECRMTLKGYELFEDGTYKRTD